MKQCENDFIYRIYETFYNIIKYLSTFVDNFQIIVDKSLQFAHNSIYHIKYIHNLFNYSHTPHNYVQCIYSGIQYYTTIIQFNNNSTIMQ